VRIAFAGSPAPAATVLGALIEAGQDVAVVISQPDRPRGRGGRTVPTPVSAAADRLAVPLRRPASINEPAMLDELAELGVRAVCVAGFGQILRDRLLETWPCLNVHFSVLPAYRGAAPVERALMDGCNETGVTIMQMDAGLDTGPIISIGRTPITPEDDAGSLLDHLAILGGEHLVAALDDLDAGRLLTTPQPAEGVSLAPKIGDDDIALDPSRAAVEVANRIRALSPHIGAACLVDDQRFKLWKARPASSGQMPAGTLWVEEGRLLLPCADGAVEILELQPPNRSRMDASAFLRGWRGGLALGTVRRDTP
jgi:methionyl-tRNA formyltransferase